MIDKILAWFGIGAALRTPSEPSVPPARAESDVTDHTIATSAAPPAVAAPDATAGIAASVGEPAEPRSATVGRAAAAGQARITPAIRRAIPPTRDEPVHDAESVPDAEPRAGPDTDSPPGTPAASFLRRLEDGQVHAPPAVPSHDDLMPPDPQEIQRRRDLVRTLFNDFWSDRLDKPAAFVDRLDEAETYLNERLSASGEFWQLDAGTRKMLGLPPRHSRGEGGAAHR